MGILRRAHGRAARPDAPISHSQLRVQPLLKSPAPFRSRPVAGHGARAGGAVWRPVWRGAGDTPGRCAGSRRGPRLRGRRGLRPAVFVQGRLPGTGVSSRSDFVPALTTVARQRCTSGDRTLGRGGQCHGPGGRVSLARPCCRRIRRAVHLMHH